MKAFFRITQQGLNDSELLLRLKDGKVTLTNRANNPVELRWITENAGQLAFSLEDAVTVDDAFAALKQYVYQGYNVEAWTPVKAEPKAKKGK